ncbi:ExbD/TolR family protein [Mucilaginibacter sp.]|uniref:ExbD/TolR family protein n=1 Tax=Mucilaginibacter sp. TaxID=1882438 RepID=UPI003D0A7794
MAELNQSSGRSGSKKTLKKLPPNVDLTAMVDLAFLLITFFMLTTSLAKPRIMPVVMPSNGPSGAVSEKTTMTICLGKNNQVLWYLGMAGKPLNNPQVTSYGSGVRSAIIQTKIQVLASTGKPLMVLVKPSDHSIYDNLVNTLDEISTTEVPSYAIAKIEPKDIELLKQKGIY